MTPQQLKQQVEQRNAEVDALTVLWQSMVTGFCPTSQQFSVWLQLHTFERVTHAVTKTGRKFLRLDGQMDADHLVRFCSSVANEEKTRTASRGA
jgi:hypothetical protein